MRRSPELDWAALRKAVIAARDQALGMGHMERVGPELVYDRSRPLGPLPYKVCRRLGRARNILVALSKTQVMDAWKSHVAHASRSQVWEGRLVDGRKCAVKQVDIAQGQQEHELLSKLRKAGRCEHVIDYYTGFELAEVPHLCQFPLCAPPGVVLCAAHTDINVS